MWLDNNKMDIRDRMVWYGLDWSGLRYGPVEGSNEHDNEPSGYMNMLEGSWVTAQLGACQE
jgi:hypothetical protein